MITKNKSYFSYKTALVSAILAIALALGLFALPAAPARAQSQQVLDLIAEVNRLLAELNSIEGINVSGGVSLGVCPYTWTRSLGVGSSGADVMRLQQFLNSSPDTRLRLSGAGSPGFETQYYGPITANAVSRFQAKYRAEILAPLGLFNPTGYFGPASMAKANSLCRAVVTPPADDDDDVRGDLRGGAGSINEADFVAKLNNEEVGEGQEDVEVAGLEIEADDGSDIEITAVTIDFDQGTANRDFRRYADEVSILFNGDEVGRIDADRFEDDNDFDRTISLDKGVIIRRGETEELTVAVSGLNNIDSADEGETWNVTFDTLRFRDAQGAVVSDSSTGDIGASRTFSFEDFASAADLELKIRNSDEDINDTRTIVVDDSDDTDNVEFFSFELEVEGDSDILINDLPITFTSTGAGVGEIINTAELIVDGDMIGSESVSSTSATSRTVVFDDLDFTIDAGDTVEVIVRVDVNNTGGAFSGGDTLRAAFGETETDSADFDAEDEEGDALGDSDVTGSASTDTHRFFTTAPEVEVVSTSITAIDNGNDPAESALARITLKLTANGGTIYLNGDDESTENKRFFVGQVYGSGVSASTTASSSTFTVISGTNDVTNSGSDNEYWTLDEGESMTIRIEAIINQATVTTTSVLAGFKASAIQFGTDSTSDTTRSSASLTDSDLLDQTQSGTAALVNAS